MYKTGYGNVDITLDDVIEGIADIRKIEDAITEEDTKGVAIINYKLLRTIED